MLRRYFSLIVSLLLVSGCARHHSVLPPKPILKPLVQTRAMPSTVDSISVEGAVNVSLHTGYKHSALILRGDPRDLKEVITEMKNGSLLVRVGKSAPKFGSIGVEVRSNSLKSFTYKGVGTVVGRNLHSGYLELNIDNPGNTILGGSIVLRKLEARGGGSLELRGVHSRYLSLEMANRTRVLLVGVINLANVDLKDDSWLTMYWVKSPNLTLCARGSSNVQLAGVVNKLDLELWGTARFKGRFLRVNNAFVKTHDKSLAEITAIKHQHAFATDASDIYFYKIPQTKADFMAFQGSILDMRDLHWPDVKDYNRFNKEIP